MTFQQFLSWLRDRRRQAGDSSDDERPLRGGVFSSDIGFMEDEARRRMRTTFRASREIPEKKALTTNSIDYDEQKKRWILQPPMIMEVKEQESPSGSRLEKLRRRFLELQVEIQRLEKKKQKLF